LYQDVVAGLEKGKLDIDAKRVLTALNKYYSANKADDISAQYSVRLEEQIQDSLNSLTQHEDEWKDLQDLSHQVQGQIAEKEKEIEGAVENFKKLVRKLAYTKKVPEENYFRLQDGSVISNISGLMAALPHMSDAVFNHHVSTGKNDFADWIKHTFDDSELATAVRNCNNRKELYLKLKEAVE
jgi:Fe2+ transport system protein B